LSFINIYAVLSSAALVYDHRLHNTFVSSQHCLHSRQRQVMIVTNASQLHARVKPRDLLNLTNSVSSAAVHFLRLALFRSSHCRALSCHCCVTV